MAIVSNANGQTVRMVYFYLQENNRASGTIRTGGIIGCQDVILSFKIDNQTNKVSEIALICY